LLFFFFSSSRRHTMSKRDWSSDVCSSDLTPNCYLCTSFTRHNCSLLLSFSSSSKYWFIHFAIPTGDNFLVYPIITFAHFSFPWMLSLLIKFASPSNRTFNCLCRESNTIFFCCKVCCWNTKFPSV